jgi:hypothetical protein
VLGWAVPKPIRTMAKRMIPIRRFIVGPPSMMMMRLKTGRR